MEEDGFIPITNPNDKSLYYNMRALISSDSYIINRYPFVNEIPDNMRYQDKLSLIPLDKRIKELCPNTGKRGRPKGSKNKKPKQLYRVINK